ncbi:MOSC domain-containing protein [Aidingimonas lacisalsi]|uniref:MOSC domain-containing protein n=1 Tax=Aidingimonas lacisalsi TaxID=2604086 RepID=UPI0011D1DA9F|nr:MOSC domain-containing protein [Aidingimonas lacisalsi]
MTVTRPVVSALYRYPAKSTAGESLTGVHVSQEGIVGDRRYMVVKPDGTFVTARTHPHLQRVTVTLCSEGLVLNHPELQSLTLHHEAFSRQVFQTQVWGDVIDALTTTEEADEWLGQALGEPVKLLWLGERSPRYRQSIGQRVSFADGYPLMLIGDASLEDLNSRLEASQRMSQFRPNLVVKGALPYAEDGWQRLRIGDVELAVAKPCSRCVMITVDPSTGRFMPNREPLRTLSTYRRGPDGKILFGQNLIVMTPGWLDVGMPVDVLA